MVARQEISKPGIGEWARAADFLVLRLTECVHVYKHNASVFMAEAERQAKTDQTIKVLKRLHSLLDQAEARDGDGPDMRAYDEKIIGGFDILFRETLRDLPGISEDMQRLLKSPWMKDFPSKIAEALFLGTEEEQSGIGSGNPEHGRLPALLAAILEREEMGETRLKREETLLENPRRHDIDANARWLEQNAGYLRSAGRVD